MDFYENSFKSTSFNWFTGVVEDNDDPSERGRVKVRCFGYHNESLEEIPTHLLPWAHVMMPVTSASCGGIGQSATGILRGSWVVGFFRDGKACQDPIVLGTLPSQTPTSTDYETGFKDPYGDNPRNNLISGVANDQPFGATQEYRDSVAYANKKSARVDTKFQEEEDGKTVNKDVPTAVPPNMPQLRNEHPNNEKDYDNDYFKRLRWIQSKQEDIVNPVYPYCHTTEYRCGHVVEFDETEGAERILTHHAIGTFEEWSAEGDRTLHVTGKNYKIIIEDDNVNIKGNCNITINGNARTYIQGDSYTEVDGNYHLNVKGNVYKKCQSEFVDIGADQIFNIAARRESNIDHSEKITINALHQLKKDAEGNLVSPSEYIADSPGLQQAYQFSLKKSAKITIADNKDEEIHGNLDLDVIKDSTFKTEGNRIDTVNTGYKIQVRGNATAANNILDIDTNGNITMTTPASIDIDATSDTSEITIDAQTGSIDFPLGNITSNTRTLHTHTHTDPSHANHGTPTSAPNANT